MNSTSRLFATLLYGTSLLTACAALDSDEPVLFAELQSYFIDAAFPAPDEDFAIEPPPDFLTLPDIYRQQLDRRVASIEEEHERYRALRRWVFDTFEDFEFVTTETLSLSELNTNRKYNCLSFSSLFVAAARYVDVPANFQLVFAPPYWDQANGSWINNQHINVSGTVTLPLEIQVQWSPSIDLQSLVPTSAVRPTLNYIADINPAIVSMRSRRKIIDEQAVLSLFYSNRSVEMLIAEDLAAAYVYTKSALQTDPASSVAWNNLGVLYNRVDRPDMAEKAFQLAIANDDRAYSAMSNLAGTYRNRGKIDAAVSLENQIEEFRAQNPYYHAAMAERDFEAGDLDSARQHLLDALDRKHNEQNFYHRLAIIALQQGDYEAVMQYLGRAQRFARGEDKARFAGKIAALEDLI